MALTIENTKEWGPPEAALARIAPMWPGIVKCLRRLVSEFPDELTADFLIKEIVRGQKVLWVVFDDAQPDHVFLAVLTEWSVRDATGAKLLTIGGIGGARIHEALPLLKIIEAWGLEHGANEMRVIGRSGWRRMLKPYGYSKSVEILSKKLEPV